MRFLDTPAFRELIAPLDAEIAVLEADVNGRWRELDARRNHNASVPKSVQRPTTAITNGLARARKALDDHVHLRLFCHSRDGLERWSMPQLFKLLAGTQGGLWTPVEEALLCKDRAAHEGKGEEPIWNRCCPGTAFKPSHDTIDIPGHGEVKWVGGTIDLIKLGKHGVDAYRRVKRALFKELDEAALTPGQWDLIDGDEVSAGKVYGTAALPAFVRERLVSELAPERVLSPYPNVFLANEGGFVRVPNSDFALAFQLACITQSSPKYRLKREYVEERLALTLNEPAT